MRKIILAVALAIGLTGCGTVQTLMDASQFVTASVTNPITQERLYKVESAMVIAFAALNAYRQACLQGAAETHCRENIAKIQAYTRRIPPLMTQLRTFVANNDQINAIVVYNQVKQLIDSFKAEAAAAGIPLQGV